MKTGKFKTNREWLWWPINLDIPEERHYELEVMSIETCKTEKKKTEKMEETFQEVWDNYRRCNTHNGKKKKEYLSNNDWESTKNVRHQTIGPWSS